MIQVNGSVENMPLGTTDELIVRIRMEPGYSFRIIKNCHGDPLQNPRDNGGIIPVCCMFKF